MGPKGNDSSSPHNCGANTPGNWARFPASVNTCNFFEINGITLANTCETDEGGLRGELVAFAECVASSIPVLALVYIRAS